MPRYNPKHTSHSPKPNHNSSHASSHQPPLPNSILNSPTLTHLDGQTLEGGGQLVRLALTLSSVISIPLHIHHIRGNRCARSSSFSSSSSGKGGGGGLKSSHLAALEFLAGATAAKTWGAWVGSTEILFEPGRDRDRAKKGTDGVHEIRLEKPGSVWLILQAILPYIIFAASENVPTELVITGGTNVPKSMSGEYVNQVMCPMFEKIGLPSIEVDIRKRGWTRGRAIQNGEVSIKIHPLKKGSRLPPFALKDRGAITKIAISVLAGTPSMRSALIAQTTHRLSQKYPNLPPPEIAIDDNSADPKRLYLLLVAHTANHYRLGRDWLYDEKIKGSLNESQTEFIAAKMAQRVVKELGVEIAGGGCVDEYMQDQLVVFQTLAEGRSWVERGVGSGGEEGSLHARTCRWVAERVLGGQVGFDVGGSCTGVGFSAGEVYEDRKGVEEEIVQKNEEYGGKESDVVGHMDSSDDVIGHDLEEELEDMTIGRR